MLLAMLLIGDLATSICDLSLTAVDYGPLGVYEE
ncbi:unnamed protein product [Rhodiola kirilowii]